MIEPTVSIFGKVMADEKDVAEAHAVEAAASSKSESQLLNSKWISVSYALSASFSMKSVLEWHHNIPTLQCSSSLAHAGSWTNWVAWTWPLRWPRRRLVSPQTRR
jgi:hypothetical protein